MYGCPVSFYVWWYYMLSIGLVYIVGNKVYGFFHHLQGISLEPNLWFPTTNSRSSASASTVVDSMYCVFLLRSSGLKVRHALKMFATSRMAEVFGVSKDCLKSGKVMKRLLW